MSRLFYHFSKLIVSAFFLIFTRWRISGRENIPMNGPLLVVSNHMTFAEPPILRILLKRESRFATKEGFFRNKFIGKIMEIYGGFPVHRGRADRKAIRLMEQYLSQGLAVVIFPEGTRSLKSRLLPATHGATVIAQRTGAPILPVGITGTEKMRGLTWFFKRPVITIRFGQPFYLPSSNGKLDREIATHYIMERIAELLPPKYHGAYAKRDTK
jgi:1-acyl-sn-glycerol-3-phosphate acyltransferase